MTGRELKSVMNVRRERRVIGDRRVFNESASRCPDPLDDSRARGIASPKTRPEGLGQGHCRTRRISRLFFSKLTRRTFSPPVAKSAVMVFDSSKS